MDSIVHDIISKNRWLLLSQKELKHGIDYSNIIFHHYIFGWSVPCRYKCIVVGILVAHIRLWIVKALPINHYCVFFSAHYSFVGQFVTNAMVFSLEFTVANHSLSHTL